MQFDTVSVLPVSPHNNVGPADQPFDALMNAALTISRLSLVGID